MAARPRSYSLAPAMVGPIYYGSIPQRACPDGWRLPTAWEVINLIQSITGSYPVVFTRLIESGAGIAKSFPAISAPDGGYEEGVLMNIMVIIICWAVVSVVCMTSNLTIKQTAP